MPSPDISQHTFGRLTALRLAPQHSRSGACWECQCECGKTKIVRLSSLVNGCTKSCGCLARELKIVRATTHGFRNTPTYISWVSMKSKCTDKSSYYGKKGILVCERWLSFEAFLLDMGARPSLEYSIDRINNAGNYEPGNCRWATNHEQSLNRTDSRFIEAFGVKKNVSEWSIITNIGRDTLAWRGKQGFDPETILTAPLRNKKGRAKQLSREAIIAMISI